ncbi:MAG: isoprenyl transferase [Alphaproteobacteria bacterium]|nr:isoprenyl transferase [Alphaproteobacteria bacterium]
MAKDSQGANTSKKKLHVAIIMDGNGRWAKARLLPRPMGHRAGIDAVRRTIEAALSRNIAYLTLYSFSSENWRRPASEVGELMGLLRHYLKSELNALNKNGVRLRVIGERDRLPSDIAPMIEEAEEATKNNEKLNLTLALNYGGRQEIVAAAQTLARAVVENRLALKEIDENTFARALFTADLPDPDLVIRTSGEKRISNFLLWQSAYAEYVFLDVLWPDFEAEHLDEALEEFARRERRLGGLPPL